MIPRAERLASTRKDDMSRPQIRSHRPAAVLTDPRSTGSSPHPRLPDILGLKGTKRS